MTWQGAEVFLTKLSQPYPPAMCAQYSTLVVESSIAVQEAEAEDRPPPRALKHNCAGNPMLNGASTVWIGDEELSEEETEDEFSDTTSTDENVSCREVESNVDTASEPADV